MKTGNQVYSRPTTAKKTLLSPKTQKTDSRVKTQTRELDPNQLCEFIQATIGKQKECEAKGKYVEAEAFKRKVKALKEQLEDREMEEHRWKHGKELQELMEAHHAEMNLFNLDWQKRIEIFNQEIGEMFEELQIKHEKQFAEAEQQLENQKKFHESPKLLELRKVEQQLGRQENYIEAHRVQLTANKLEKEELQKHGKYRSTKKKSQLHLLKGRQEQELEALKMRIQLQVEERERERQRQEDILKQKYENILKETEFQQNQELITLNKKVRLNQLQKKSKVGMFSYSKS